MDIFSNVCSIKSKWAKMREESAEVKRITLIKTWIGDDGRAGLSCPRGCHINGRAREDTRKGDEVELLIAHKHRQLQGTYICPSCIQTVSAIVNLKGWRTNVFCLPEFDKQAEEKDQILEWISRVSRQGSKCGFVGPY